MTRVTTVAEISRPVEEVFDYVTTPGNWPRWHPSSLGVSGATDHPLRVGEQVTEEFQVAGRRGTVVWTVREALPPLRWRIEGEIVGAGSGGAVTYALAPMPSGTRFWREFAYDLPGTVARALDWLAIRRRVDAESAEAVRRLKAVLEGREVEPAASSRPAEFNLVSHWRIEGNVEEVAEILGEPLDLPRWWPAVYLRVEEVRPGGERRIGRVLRLLTKGWLPYLLRWEFTVTDYRPPEGFSLEARGDMAGEGEWTLRQDGPYADVTYEWRVRVDKPVLKQLAFLLKPVYAANHRWAMARGEESLRLELARRHARTPEEAARVPAPPGPASWRTVLIPTAALGALGVGLAVVLGRLGKGRT